MKHLTLTALLLIASLTGAKAQNPIVTDQYSADPTAKVFDGKLYVYPSHDIKAIDEMDTTAWFRMEDYHVFMADEKLGNWSDMGVILSDKDVPWVKQGSYSMWAPDIVKRGDKYYFLFPAQPDGNRRGFGVGIAENTRPYGRFTPRKEPIKGVFGIDPCLLQDDDGKMYLFWGGGGLVGAELDQSMDSVKGRPVFFDRTLPKGFKEGPFAFKRNGKYYLTFPWVKEKTEKLAYAMSDSPLGPYEFKGVIMDETPGCWTNHHSLVEYQNQWYLFYHTNAYSPHFDKNRSVCADSLFFNADGTIQKVMPTLRGVGITPAQQHIQIDRYSTASEGIKIDFLNRKDYFQGWKTIFTAKNAAVTYNRVDFGNGQLRAVRAYVRADKKGVLQLSLNGKAVAKIKVKPSEAWTEIVAPVKNIPAGICDVTLTSLADTDIELDWISFTASK